MRLPHARGALTSTLFAALRSRDPRPLPDLVEPAVVDDPVADDDLQLALWVCYELHYRGFEDVSDGWEWQPDLIAFRGQLEAQFLSALRAAVRVPQGDDSVSSRLWEMVANDSGKSPSRYLQREASREQFREYMAHRSIYQLKEADPHTWGIPRLSGRAKAALVEIQMDEYGNGELERMHSTLFTGVLRYLGLDDSYGGHIDAVPGITLAMSNVISLFGLHRQLRGALVGHLAVFEMNSSAPSRRISRGLRRLGADGDVCRFYDVHVTADSLHEQVAAYDLCGGLVSDEPALREDVLFGAATCLYIDGLFANQLLDRWSNGESSLRALPHEARLAG